MNSYQNNLATQFNTIWKFHSGDPEVIKQFQQYQSLVLKKQIETVLKNKDFLSIESQKHLYDILPPFFIKILEEQSSNFNRIDSKFGLLVAEVEVESYVRGKQKHVIEVSLDLTDPQILSGIAHLYECGVCKPRYTMCNEFLDEDGLIKKDYARAVYWYGQAVAAINPQNITANEPYLDKLSFCQWKLGQCYEQGEGYPKDEKAAFQCYMDAAALSYAPAQLSVALCYDKGIGVRQDKQTALVWYQKAAEGNLPEALYHVGECYRTGSGAPKDEKLAVSYYKKASPQGHAQAQFELGLCYAEGVGVPKDEKMAVSLYQKSADQGNVQAFIKLGLCYLHGKGIVIDKRKAFFWIQNAAQQHNAYAQNLLGVIYEKGHGVAIDFKSAVYWYYQSAMNGNNAARSNLAVCYVQGRGVPKNLAAASVWCRQIDFRNASNDLDPLVILPSVLLASINSALSQVQFKQVLKRLRHQQVLNRLRHQDVSLTEIDLSYQKLEAQQIQELLNAIPQPNVITKVKLQHTYLKIDDICKLIHKLPKIVDINLSGNQLNTAEVISCLAQLHYLQSANLSNNKIDELKAILSALMNTNMQLKSLDLEFNQIALSQPELDEVIHMLARTALTQLNLKNTLIKKHHLEKLEKYFLNVNAAIETGDRYYQQHEFELAKTWYKNALRQDPNNDQIEYRLFHVYFDLEQFQKAHTSIENVMRHNSDYHYVYERGRTLYQLKEYDRALACFNTCIKNNPQNKEYYSEKAKTLHVLKRHQEAIHCLDHILKNYPNDDACYMLRMYCFMELGNYREALGCIEWLLKKFPNFSTAMVEKSKLMNFYFKQDNPIAVFLNDYNLALKKYLNVNHDDSLSAMFECVKYLDQDFSSTTYSQEFQEMLENKLKTSIRHLTQALRLIYMALPRLNKTITFLNMITEMQQSLQDMLLRLKQEYIECKENLEAAEKNFHNLSAKYDRCYNQHANATQEYKQNLHAYNQLLCNEYSARNIKLEDYTLATLNESRDKERWAEGDMSQSRLAKEKAESKVHFAKSLFTWKQFYLDALTELSHKLEPVLHELRANCPQNEGCESGDWEEENFDKPQAENVADEFQDENFHQPQAENGVDAFQEDNIDQHHANTESKRLPSLPKVSFFGDTAPRSQDVFAKLMSFVNLNDEKQTLKILNSYDKINEIIDVDIGTIDDTKPGWTLLHLACDKGFFNIAVMLMKANPDINISNKLGDTALHIAVNNNRVDFVEMLIDYQADITQKNAKHQTAKQLALEKGFTEIVSLIDEMSEANESWKTTHKAP